MEAFFSLTAHLSLLILLFLGARSDTLTGNGVADQWRHHSVNDVEGSIKGFQLREDMAFSPESSPLAAPAPTPGGVVSASPDYIWPFHSKQVSSPSSPPTNSPSPTVPSADTGEGMPFINSNPTVPLPTGEADSVTIRPLPTSGHQDQMEAVLAFQIPVSFMVCLILLKG